MKANLARIQALLATETTLVLATTDQNLMPRATPLFYLAEEDLRLYWFSSRSSAHSRNCRRSPEAAVAVYRDARGWRQICGVQMRGLVFAVKERDLRRSIAQKYCARLALGSRFAPILARSTLYCFTPRRARFMENAHCFGDKFEMDFKIPLMSSSSRRRSSGKEKHRRAAPRAG